VKQAYAYILSYSLKANVTYKVRAEHTIKS